MAEDATKTTAKDPGSQRMKSVVEDSTRSPVSDPSPARSGRSGGSSVSAPPGTTLIVIPAHNEEKNIANVLDELLGLELGFDVLVVDDASTDDTARVLRERKQRFIRLATNLGYGGAVQAGLKYALTYGYDFVLQMDGDGQHDPKSIPALLAPVHAGKTDVALGSRFKGTLTYQVPWARRMGIAFFKTVVSLFLKQRITDPTSGFQALTRRVLRFYASDAYPMDYPDSDVLLALHFAGFRIEEVPVSMRPRVHGQSIHRSWKTIYYVLKMFLAIFVVLSRHYGRRNRGKKNGTEKG
jgi:glycosyltransferase involved in cell wall biosynthesis